MKQAFALLVLLGASSLPAQSPAPLIVDVHASPYRKQIVYRTNSNPDRTNISPNRFEMRHATICDMIALAYNLGEQDDDRENPYIAGGPTWIDWDRFDIVAKIPPGNPTEQFRSILKRVLAEHFHLAYRQAEYPLPGFVVTVAKDGPRLSEAKNPDAPNASTSTRNPDKPDQFVLTYTSETMAQFIATLDQEFPHPIVDRTGLTRPYDFSLKLALGPDIHTRDDRARVYTDALARQLGLAVVRANVPQMAFVVDKVDRIPTPNPPEVADLLPALPDLEFEVASIRPAAANEPQSQVLPSGSQITFSSMQLSELITRAWQLPTGQMLGDALPLLPQTRYTILVKLPLGIDSRAVNQDPDQIANMLRKLLVDRFHVQSHWGEWTQPDAYVLLAGTPRMKHADPASRSFCKFGPAEGEKAARFAGSAYDAEFHCQNVTMAQFAGLVQAMAGTDVKNRVPDKTNLAGAFDFTVFYTSGRTLRSRTAAAAKAAGGDALVPVDGLSVEDAFRRQLGLRLEKQPLTLPSLILDHFDQTPSVN